MISHSLQKHSHSKKGSFFLIAGTEDGKKARQMLPGAAASPVNRSPETLAPLSVHRRRVDGSID
jgi:hypothetical protein